LSGAPPLSLSSRTTDVAEPDRDAAIARIAAVLYGYREPLDGDLSARDIDADAAALYDAGLRATTDKPGPAVSHEASSLAGQANSGGGTSVTADEPGLREALEPLLADTARLADLLAERYPGNSDFTEDAEWLAARMAEDEPDPATYRRMPRHRRGVIRGRRP
jgi:hypothetical protein